MAVVVPAPPPLAGDVSLFHTTDPLLANSPVLVFYGRAAAVASTSSRIQVHVFTPAGIGSYRRLAVAPTSPFWSAVDSLPRDAKGDEVCRGIAFGLKKYFAELPERVRTAWCAQVRAAGMLFGDQHVAILASRMQRVENTEDVIYAIGDAFAEQWLSWLDVDVVLPPGSVVEMKRSDSIGSEDSLDIGLEKRYGRYAEVVACLGEAIFMPTSKLRRAPSKASAFGRSTSFTSHQQEIVRKELSELVDTEDGYVERLQELHGIAMNSGADLKASSQEQLKSVFPASISRIVAANSKFLQSMRSILEATEASSATALEMSQSTASQMRANVQDDPHGIVAFARCLYEWVPQFAEPYGPYLGAQAACSQNLRSLCRNSDTALSAFLHEIGEQKLVSLLIEPVQRLPRYNLYIDSILKQLPLGHAAIKPLLKARDVITEICAQDDAGAESSLIEERLRSRVAEWPNECHITGRLVTATDYTMLAPPFAPDGCEMERGIMLLYTDSLILLEKRGDAATTTARSLQTELEACSNPAFSRSGPLLDLNFVRQISLDALQYSESHAGRVLQLFELLEKNQSRQSSNVMPSWILRLDTTYDGKVNRFTEDISKAAIESRFSEVEREGSAWEVRRADAGENQASLLCAIFQDSNREYVSLRRRNGSTRVIVDVDKHIHKPQPGQNGIRTVISLSPLKDGSWRMTLESLDYPTSQEPVTLENLVHKISKRLAMIAASSFSIDNPAMAASLLAKNGETISSLDLYFLSADDDDASQVDSREPTRRHKSPRKLLSTFLASTGPGSQPPASIRRDQSQLRHPTSAQSTKPPSREGATSLHSQPSFRAETPTNHRKLEDTLRTYILALKARKGNIVGRSLKMRGLADELAVNELYNGLLEDANMMVIAAQATVDVLFAAFEKFLNHAWKEQVGQVIPYTMIQSAQSKAELMFPADFDDYFRSVISTLVPQNRRAFKMIMELLADLLDGTGNDGDRGALTAAFAEVLVTDGNPHDFIALIDRFVDDTDTYFGEPLDEVQKQGNSGGLHKRSRSTNSASISSNTSSLRRKFGFGTLARTNSRSEEESKVASVWRTLSKSTRGGDSPAGSLSKGSLHRSQSTMDYRPTSQDGSLKGELSAAASVQSLGLSTIGEHPSFIPTGPPRKKRRSSLSDVLGAEEAQKAPSWTAPAPARRPVVGSRSMTDEKPLESPLLPAPKLMPNGRVGSPVRERARIPPAFRKENSPSRPLSAIEPLRPRSNTTSVKEEAMSSRPSSSIPTIAARGLSPTKPTPRIGLSERTGAGNIVKRPSTPPDKSTRLRMQSPQKLRERLQHEQVNMNGTQGSLQEELSKIGDELTATSTSRIGTIRGSQTARVSRRGSVTSPSGSLDMAARVLKLEGKLQKAVEDHSARMESIQNDLSSSLTVSENKCRKLDELYREARCENDALYARFNEELSKILNVVRGGEGVEEMKRRLKEAQDDAAKLRRENGRLKRENVGLRAQIKGD
ncbi:hypothetical protein K470DRAFT_281366 [Piedraia hortae CBS 480.64]|uniref:DH domain-containing protein n=1 Tax=Piedraia hortae CBS 480.64 TaxID=1314780 RepID=A0A6A7C450_9PEZI|nr:hypothetical protein K470DRAFT_281366 [Piedraia hortae CBS 480.64]